MHWICWLFGHKYGDWFRLSLLAGDRQADQTIRGCARCAETQFVSPSGNVPKPDAK